MENKEVVVIGAGPYGLSTTAHLVNSGVDTYVFGETLSFWKQNMPKNMLLRSRTEASNIDAPRNICPLMPINVRSSARYRSQFPSRISSPTVNGCKSK